MARQHLTEPQWVDEFLNRLSLLLPSIEAHEATAHAQLTFGDRGGADPVAAAEDYALEFHADAG